METLQLELAERRLSELQAQLERLRPHILERRLAGRLAPDDLEQVMELDAEIERAAMHLKALRQRSKA